MLETFGVYDTSSQNLRNREAAMTSTWAQTREVEETLALGRRMGHALTAGDVLGLIGPLGAGKTQLVHGLLQGLVERYGSPKPVRVCSPSYTVINTYLLHDTLQVHHLDLYRLHDIDDLESTGYWDAVEDPNAVVLIEWLDQIEGAAPASFVNIHIDPREDGTRHWQLKPTDADDLFERLQQAAPTT